MMIRCLDEHWIGDILAYIGEDYKTAFYPYINLSHYGLKNPHVKVWADEKDGRLQGIYLQYYDCLHFFTKEHDAYPCRGFLDMLAAQAPRVIMAQQEFGQRIHELICDRYRVQKSYIVDLQIAQRGQIDERVELANRDDLAGIAELMLADTIYHDVYEKSTLIAQLTERYEEGFSRFFVIKMDGKIVAVYSTYGECKKVAIVSGLLVHPEYRRKGLASAIVKHAHAVLGREGMDGISLLDYENTATLEFHRELGVNWISSLYKFVRIG